MDNIEKLVTEKKVVSVNQIIVNPWNPNRQSDIIFQKMKKTIDEKGLFGSIIVRPYLGGYQILDGEHRFKACKELGYTKIPVECSVKEISDSDTKFWTLYFNNTKGKDDIEKVAQIFETLDEGQAQLLPFSEDEIRNTKELFKFDFAQYEKTDPEIPENEFVKILSFKLSQDEWKAVEQVFMYAKQEKLSEKQIFMLMLREYMQFRALIPFHIAVDNLG